MQVRSGLEKVWVKSFCNGDGFADLSRKDKFLDDLSVLYGGQVLGDLLPGGAGKALCRRAEPMVNKVAAYQLMQKYLISRRAKSSKIQSKIPIHVH